MRKTVAALILLATVAGTIVPAAAAGLTGMGKAIFGDAVFQFRKANLKSVPVKAISVGGVKIELQNTRLGELQKAFGGTIMKQGEGAGRATWLCYTTDGSSGPAANVWFISNALGGHEFIMMVAAELARSKKPSPDCGPAPAKFTLPSLGIPSLGASTADLKAAFGATPSSRGAISYRADEPGRDALGTSNNAQYIGYLVSKGIVSAVGVGESSAQIAP